MKDKKQLNIEIGNRIRIVREASKLTQEKFAERIEVSTQYVSDLERGVVGASIATIVRICDVLKVSADYLLRGRLEQSGEMSVVLDKLRYLSPEERAIVEDAIDLLLAAFSVHT